MKAQISSLIALITVALVLSSASAELDSAQSRSNSAAIETRSYGHHKYRKHGGHGHRRRHDVGEEQNSQSTTFIQRRSTGPFAAAAYVPPARVHERRSTGPFATDEGSDANDTSGEAPPPTPVTPADPAPEDEDAPPKAIIPVTSGTPAPREGDGEAAGPPATITSGPGGTPAPKPKSSVRAFQRVTAGLSTPATAGISVPHAAQTSAKGDDLATASAPAPALPPTTRAAEEPNKHLAGSVAAPGQPNKSSANAGTVAPLPASPNVRAAEEHGGYHGHGGHEGYGGYGGGHGGYGGYGGYGH